MEASAGKILFQESQAADGSPELPVFTLVKAEPEPEAVNFSTLTYFKA